MSLVSYLLQPVFKTLVKDFLFSSVSKYLLTSYYWVFPVNDIETVPSRTHVWWGIQFPRVSPCVVDGLRVKTGSFHVCAIRRKPTVGV